MSKTCTICGRGTTASFSKSHSNIKTKTTAKINLQTKKIGGKKVKICTKCIKNLAHLPKQSFCGGQAKKASK